MRRCSWTAFLTLCCSCGATESTQPQPVFGGEGASVGRQADERPLTAADRAEPVRAGPCAEASPPGDNGLIDNFEDGDHQVFKAFEREGWWFTATDGTPGEQVEPPKSGFKPLPLPVGEATNDNEMAVHLQAAGMNDWGASWGMTLVWIRDGIRCPYNGSKFNALRFRAKGPATIIVKFNTTSVTPTEFGGTCTDNCWDAYAKLVRIKEDWQTYTIRWDQLQQGGWGKDVRFEPDRFVTIQFAAEPKLLPVDFWLDDVELITTGS